METKVMFEQLDEIPYQGTSNCCGEPVYADIYICSDCGEHCALECENCEGSGSVREHSREWDIDERWKNCPECSGTGEKEL